MLIIILCILFVYQNDQKEQENNILANIEKKRKEKNKINRIENEKKV